MSRQGNGVFLFVLLLIVFLAGCVQPKDSVVCNQPYIRFAASCCLDRNNDSVCDNDQGKVIPSNAASCSSLGTDLVAYYKEDNPSAHTDETGRYDAVDEVEGAVSVPGKIGNAFRYNSLGLKPSDTSNDPRVHAVFPGAHAWPAATVTTWIRFSPSKYGGIILGFQESTNYGHRMMFRLDNKTILAYLYNGHDGPGYAAIFSRVVPDDGWHHYAYEWDVKAKTERLYIDGVLEDTATAATIGSITDNFWWGSWFNGYGMNGEIDELGVWSRILSDDEIKKLYADGKGLSYPFCG